jgi:hypothetical protein
MNDKKTSAVQRVLKSVVGPALGTSIALLLGCSTSAPTKQTAPEKAPPVKQPDTTNAMMPVGKIVAVSQPTPTSVPASVPSEAPYAGLGLSEPAKKTPKPGIVKPGTKPPPKVGKAIPEDEMDVGLNPFNKKTTRDPVLPGTLKRANERPSRPTRRATDESSSLFRTGFVGGRKLS